MLVRRAFSKTLLFLFAALYITGCKEKENLSVAPEILSFSIRDVSGKVTIDHQKGLVEMTVPFGTVINELVPDIAISEGADIVPATTVPQNFTKPVYYTLTAGTGSKKVYQVVLLTTGEPVPEIVSIAKETLQAGDSLEVKGHNFGTRALALKAFVKDKVSNSEVAVPFQLVDSTRVLLILPSTLRSGEYFIVLDKNKLKTISHKTVRVRIHSPVITAIQKQHILQGDTLVVAGNFIFPAQYKYRIILQGTTRVALDPVASSEAKLAVPIPPGVEPGVYSLFASNVDEGSTGPAFGGKVVVYDRQLPFIKAIIDSKSAYREGDTVRFSTVNFGNIEARFYTIHLSNAGTVYSQNGVFSAAGEVLYMTIPPGLPAGTYQLNTTFLDGAGKSLYEFGMNEQIILK